MWRRLLVVLGLAAFASYFLRRRVPAPPPAAEVDPSEDLRRKLEESRVGEQEPADADSPVADLDARRREVHARGRAAVDEMHGSTD
jgi:hypothetical protein